MVYQKLILLGQFMLRNSLQSSYLELLTYWLFGFPYPVVHVCLYRSIKYMKDIQEIHVYVISSINGFQIILMILRAIYMLIILYHMLIRLYIEP